ncbi:hypothetical protein QR680_016748 [Steinernema hermaphroditum]|uniref:CNH domain-containing protein n=1 Tax=Steinernema hermaphroditum TaxID=289476 RepID=A0AA39HEB8_9BILA|nr:hypothetical protein QR680_016748 [Steinernema hermaphroditum]
MTSPRLFCVETRLHLETILRPDEVVTAVSGSSADFFFGTNVGRLYHLRIDAGDVVPVKEFLLVQKPHPIVNILPASAFDLLVIQCGHSLVYMDLETFSVRSRGASNQTSCVALNVDPVLDDPFVLSFAFGTTSRQIHVVERKKDSNNVVQKISIGWAAETLCYSKQSLCYATNREYFVHDLVSGKTHSLFPYESEVVRPLAIRVDKDEFLLSGMQGLLVFATSDESPPRTPLFCGAKKIMSLVFHQPFVHILSDDSLIVFR